MGGILKLVVIVSPKRVPKIQHKPRGMVQLILTFPGVHNVDGLISLVDRFGGCSFRVKPPLQHGPANPPGVVSPGSFLCYQWSVH